MTIDTARENSGAIANNFDKDKVQSEINLQVEVTKKFDQNRQEVKAEINKKIDKAKSENQAILDKQEGEIPLSREEEQQLAAYNKKVENYQQLGVLLDVVTSGLSSPTSSGLGIAASSLSPVASYEIGQYFKEKGTEGSSAHILAHTVLGAAVAAAGSNDALTAGLVAGGAEAAAPALSNFLYNKKTSDLTADEKSTISAILGLAATGISGIASGGDIATAVQSGQGAQNAVENNNTALNSWEFDELKNDMTGQYSKDLLEGSKAILKKIKDNSSFKVASNSDLILCVKVVGTSCALRSGERYATAKEAADKGGEILITTAASYGAGKALEPVVFSISKSGVVSKATNYFKNFGGRNKIGLNKTFKGIEKKSNQADGVLVQVDLSKDEMANIANRMWGKNNGKSITVIIFQNSSNSVFEFKRP